MDLISIREVAALSNRTREAVYYWLGLGFPPPVKKLNRVYFPRVQAEAWLKENKVI